MRATVAIIGAGGMGSWFARFFKSRRYSVTVTDRNGRKARLLASRLGVGYAPNNIDAVQGSRIVVVATPVDATASTIREILQTLDRNTLLCEISATKSTVMPALQSAQKGGYNVASIHPMFGPLADGIRGRRLLLIRTGNNARTYQMVKRLIRGARIIPVDGRTHDERMALTLGLPHLLNMAFAMTLSRKGKLADIRRYAGRTFDLQMLLTQAIASEPGTVADIQISNRQFLAVLREFQREIRWLAEIVDKRDRAKLVSRYKQVRRALSTDPEFKVARKTFEKVTEAYSAATKSQRW